uniref:FZ domain-containing protein n=1 Tax=Glossina austeni TaxID=7395 RepID=A0A1A9VDU4_GLOAU
MGLIHIAYTCLGAKIPYEYTSLDLTTFDDQTDVEEHLGKFQALKHVPKCWTVTYVFTQCDTHFPSKCNNDVREIKFNLMGECLDPLVTTESSASYYPLIEGCGVRCNDPLYAGDEHRQVHKLISWVATMSFLAKLFVVTTFFMLRGKHQWLAQFFPGSCEDIVCRKDGTLLPDKICLV